VTYTCRLCIQLCRCLHGRCTYPACTRTAFDSGTHLMLVFCKKRSWLLLRAASEHANLAFCVCRISLRHSVSTRRMIVCALQATMQPGSCPPRHLENFTILGAHLVELRGGERLPDAIDGLTPALSTSQFDVIQRLKAWCSRPRSEPIV
jgi:hypothetical protein